MGRSGAVIPKPKGGRAATGRDPVRAIRLSDEFLARVDSWAAEQEDQPGRSEAIRRLVEIGLASGKRSAKLEPREAKKAMKAIARSSAEMAAIAKAKKTGL
jgi:metal-responsive CopG/Arc/MetJ family transcriptional regulator